MNERATRTPQSILAVGVSLALALSLGLPLAAPTAALGVTSAEKQKEADQIADKVDALQDQLNEASAEYERAMDSYDAATAAAEDAELRAQIAHDRIMELQGHLGNRAKSMYKTGGNTNFLEVVLGATSFESFLTSWDAMQTIADQDAGMIEESKQKRAEAESAEAEYRQQQAKAEEEMRSAEEAQAEIETAKAAMEEELEKVTEEVAVLQAREEEERMAAEEAAKRQSASDSIVVPGGIVEGWVHPCPGYTYISTEFGYSSWHGYWHNGTDLAAPAGTPIMSAGPGTVSYVGWYGGGGNTVIVTHGGGVRTIYMHMSRQAATVGQSVAAGTVIGYVGTTGQSTGNHLHFQVEVNGTPVNARNFVNL